MQDPVNGTHTLLSPQIVLLLPFLEEAKTNTYFQILSIPMKMKCSLIQIEGFNVIILAPKDLLVSLYSLLTPQIHLQAFSSDLLVLGLLSFLLPSSRLNR